MHRTEVSIFFYKRACASWERSRYISGSELSLDACVVLIDVNMANEILWLELARECRMELVFLHELQLILLLLRVKHGPAQPYYLSLLKRSCSEMIALALNRQVNEFLIPALGSLAPLIYL